MKKLVSLFALVSMLVAGSAFAIIDSGDNSLGVYFDSPAFSLNCVNPTAYVPFNMYFVLANPTIQNLGGFEFAWRLNPAPNPAPVFISTTLPANALNIGTNYNLIVGLGSGLISSEATVLVSFNLMLMAPPASNLIQVGPANPATVEGHAAFNNFVNPAQMIMMNFATVDGPEDIDATGWVVPGVGRFACDGPVATEAQTWGGVKALFE